MKVLILTCQAASLCLDPVFGEAFLGKVLTSQVMQSVPVLLKNHDGKHERS